MFKKKSFLIQKIKSIKFLNNFYIFTRIPMHIINIGHFQKIEALYPITACTYLSQKITNNRKVFLLCTFSLIYFKHNPFICFLEVQPKTCYNPWGIHWRKLHKGIEVKHLFIFAFYKTINPAFLLQPILYLYICLKIYWLYMHFSNGKPITKVVKYLPLNSYEFSQFL